MQWVGGLSCRTGRSANKRVAASDVGKHLQAKPTMQRAALPGAYIWVGMVH